MLPIYYEVRKKVEEVKVEEAPVAEPVAEEVVAPEAPAATAAGTLGPPVAPSVRRQGDLSPLGNSGGKAAWLRGWQGRGRIAGEDFRRQCRRRGWNLQGPVGLH